MVSQFKSLVFLPQYTFTMQSNELRKQCSRSMNICQASIYNKKTEFVNTQAMMINKYTDPTKLRSQTLGY